MSSEPLDTEPPAQLCQRDRHHRIIVSEHRQIHMMAGSESHPATASGKLIELEYLTHLENMPQTKRAFPIEPAKGIEALESLARQGKVVAS